MPTAFVAAKSVPSTSIESPGSPDDGVNVMESAAVVTANIVEMIKSDRKAMMAAAYIFFRCCILCHLLELIGSII
jgi:hypothetical protein